MEGGSKWQASYLVKAGKMERCLLGNKEIQVPESFLEQKNIFNSVMSQETWNKVLTESQRQHLMTFLPKFPENDNEEKRDTLRKLFNGENIKFGNPLQHFHYQLKDGSYSPDIARYTGMIHKIKEKEYRDKQKKYYHNLLKEVLLSRQKVFDQLSELGPDEPIKFEYDPPKQKDSPLKFRAHRKYKRYLEEARHECGLEESSSDDEFGSSVQKSKKQLFKSLNPVPSPEPVIPSVHATYAAKFEFPNGDIDTPVSSLKRPRPLTPPELTEDSYRDMLVKHRRRQLYDDYDDEDHPEYNTQNITLQDVLARCQASRKGGHEPDDDDMSYPIAHPKPKVKKEKGEKRLRKKPSNKIRDMDLGSSVADADDEDDESKTNISVDVTEDDTSTVQDFPAAQAIEVKEEVVGKCACFFSLIKNIILTSPDNRISTVKLEGRIRSWMDTPYADDNTWLSTHDDWLELIPSALKFLAGETIGMNVDQFIPYLDYKERAQQWHWIGFGRDTDEALAVWSEHWLKHKEEVAELIVDSSQGSPPPARWKTGYVVKATSEEEKYDFQKQEKMRFDEPHKAFTYEMHGYKSVVGPVKGVFAKKSDMTKAREHALLVSNRPAFVTILTLVRDSVARLPNGEGTRGDICELLKDSQFLAPGITDAQINVVVSGALDRLHSEKDPCVRYDVNRKVWIYLHRNRTEVEFEKIHQAQAAAQKAKKSLSKPKTAKSGTVKLRDISTSQASSVTTTATLQSGMGSSSESINVEEVSPGQPVSQAQLLTTHLTQSQVASPRTVNISAGPKTTSRQSAISSSKAASITQSLTPAQLQLLQQAAAAQAAHVKAQAEAQAAKSALSKTQAQVKTEHGSPTHGDLVSKLQGHLKVIPQTAVLPPGAKVTAPPNLTLQAQPLTQGQIEGQGQHSPAIHVVNATTRAVTTATNVASPVTMISSSQAGTNPLVARLVQQMSAGGQMVSVSNLLAAQRSLQQSAQPRVTTAFKIQGGNVIHQVSGGKPVQLSGKPMAQAKGQLVQLAGGKGQQTLGLIQTPQGTINIIPQGSGTGGLVTLSQQKSHGSEGIKVGSPSSVSQAQTSQVVKTVSPGTPGMVVTQLTSGGNITLRPAGAGSSSKVMTPGQAGLLPAQLILQQTPSGLKTLTDPQATDTSGSTSLLVSSAGATLGSPSLQIVRNVLSQQAGLKPGQATILISQQALQQGGQVLPPGQILQTTRATPGKSPAHGKQPMFARLITPPANMKLTGGVQTIPSQGQLIHTVGASGQTISVPSDSALRQTLSKLVTGGNAANVILTSGGSTISTSQQLLAAAAAGKAAQIKEMEKEKKSGT